MRIFYVFKVKDIYCDMYYSNQYKLYKILYELYCIKDYNVNDTKSKLIEIIDTNNDNLINKNINDEWQRYDNYFYRLNTHIICDNYEYTKLIVDDNFIMIRSNQNYPIFLNCIKEYNYFVCDFVNKDYFFLNLKKIIA